MSKTVETFEVTAETKFLTLKDLAERSGLPYRSLLEEADAGTLPSIRFSQTGKGRRYVSEKDFNDWLIRKQQVATIRPDDSVSRGEYAVANNSGNFALSHTQIQLGQGYISSRAAAMMAST